MHGADREVGLPHLLSQPVDLPLRVAENHRLVDNKSFCFTRNKKMDATWLDTITRRGSIGSAAGRTRSEGTVRDA